MKMRRIKKVETMHFLCSGRCSARCGIADAVVASFSATEIVRRRQVLGVPEEKDDRDQVKQPGNGDHEDLAAVPEDRTADPERFGDQGQDCEHEHGAKNGGA